jgi:serine/threonine protein kinase
MTRDNVMYSQIQDEKQSVESLVGQIAGEFTERLNRGERPEVEEYAARHPEIASILRQALPALEAVELLAPGPGSAPEPGLPPNQITGCLGDYRIIREIGRGGMGIVYEAEQISLGRRVALKVLPFAATMDPRQLQRFQNEARAAASLEHPHIVPVYGVGCDRAVHYYAMKFIDGQSLADLIRYERAHSANGVASAPRVSNAPILEAPAQPRSPETAVAAHTERAPRDAASFRQIAEWGIQAAEALEHAHSLGIVHRDIKPANLMLDVHGKLWITDFGLARTAADPGLTMMGDLLGTLRYMSPEQAQAKHGLVDHRTDIYSLAVTLYELLTREPVWGETDRQELLRCIVDMEPKPPRRINKSIPPSWRRSSSKRWRKIRPIATPQPRPWRMICSAF